MLKLTILIFLGTLAISPTESFRKTKFIQCWHKLQDIDYCRNCVNIEGKSVDQCVKEKSNTDTGSKI